jgi:hypothetical protein
VVWVGF